MFNADSHIRPFAAGHQPIRIAATSAGRYAVRLFPEWLGNPPCRLLLFLSCYLPLRVIHDSKQAFAEHFIQHPDVMRQNCRPKTKLERRTMFTFKSALLFWLLASSVPLLTSLAYFRASPVTDSLAQRISVSLHGVTVSALCIAAVLVGMVGTPRPSLAEPFHLLLLVPVVLALYSFWRFRGNKAIHLLQSINLLWLALASFFGSMAVTGVWL